MKNIFFLIVILSASSTGILLAQFDGKQFLSGSAAINFGNINPKNDKATNGYGYNFDIALGKFQTNAKAAGWRLSNSLGGAKNVYRTYNENGMTGEYEKSGINNVGFGVGRFWQWYKHFNEKTGFFAGPNVDLTYSNSKEYTLSSDNSYLFENRINKIQISAGLSAGLYYRFSDKWWITGSLAFSNPFSIDYAFSSSKNVAETIGFKQKQLNYSFSPNFTFPSVGFGLRYFYNR